MKLKQLITVVAIMVIAYSCGNQSSKTDKLVDANETVVNDEEKSNKASVKRSYTGAEVAYVREGKLYFYFPETKQSVLLKEEKDTVFSCVFDKTKNIIYYTVIKENLVCMKKADYEADNDVEIKFLFNSQVRKENFLTEPYKEHADLYFYNNNVYFCYDYDFEEFADFTTMEKYSLDEFKVYSVGEEEINYKHFGIACSDVSSKTENGDFIYTENNKAINLTSNIEFENKESVSYRWPKLSADKSKLIFAADLGSDSYHFVNGVYIIADTDGENQTKLIDTQMAAYHNPVFLGNQVVFISSGLYITNADDNSATKIDDNVDDFAVRKF